jgi:two-component system, NarL family, sensor kinase
VRFSRAARPLPPVTAGFEAVHYERVSHAEVPGDEAAPRSPARRARLAWSLAWGSLALTEAAVVTALVALVASGLPWKVIFPSYALSNAWLAATLAPFGAVVAARRPGLLIGWLFCAYALCYGLAAAGVSLCLWSLALGHLSAWSAYAGWFGISIWTLGAALCLPLIIVLFPDGHLPSPRWRWLVCVIVASSVLWLASWATDPSAVAGTPWARYVPVLTGSWGHAAHWTDNVMHVGVDVILLATLAGLLMRWGGSAGRQRSQLSWLLWGVTIALLLEAPTNVQEFLAQGTGAVWPAALMLGFPVLPIAATIALLRHQLLDIDVVINRTLVYAGLTAGLILGYLAVTALGRAALGHDPGLGGSLVAAGAVAVAFAPARQFLQRKVDTMLYGDRRDPARALTEVSATLGAADDELASAVLAVSQSLRLPDALLEAGGRQIGRAGPASRPATEVPLRYRAETVGRLLVWPRRGQTALHPADLTALQVVAGPLAAAVNAMRLSDQLQRSREQLITARDEERRRLHQDLHDGLGPALTAVALKADAAGNLLAADPSGARSLLAQVSAEARDSIADVRRIAHDLRPPTLDELGLAGALRHEAAQFTRRLDGHPLIVTVDAPAAVPGLDPAVEAAAYRVAAEALTNAARHSTASAVEIRLHAGPALCIEIADNGAQREGQWTPGFGLSGMRQRVADLGGRFEAGPAPAGGTVRAEFPLQSPGQAG